MTQNEAIHTLDEKYNWINMINTDGNEENSFSQS